MRALVLIAAFLLTETCGQQAGEKGIGEPCTRDEECLEGLVCVGGVCHSPPDAGDDAG